MHRNSRSRHADQCGGFAPRMDSARVGAVIPRDLPYGGGVDITDQLHGLQ
ncbi:MAG: hypothetical protein R2686_03875 [Candidatus Nanopelagicales bacterium]